MDRSVEIIARAVGLPSVGGPVLRVLVGPTTDSEGESALDVVVVLKEARLNGRDAVTIVTDVQRALLDAGDARVPIIEFATEDELALDGGAEA